MLRTHQRSCRDRGFKDFGKIFLKKYNIPTAGCQTFSNYAEAENHPGRVDGVQVVIKVDGFAAG